MKGGFLFLSFIERVWKEAHVHNKAFYYFCSFELVGKWSNVKPCEAPALESLRRSSVLAHRKSHATKVKAAKYLHNAHDMIWLFTSRLRLKTQWALENIVSVNCKKLLFWQFLSQEEFWSSQPLFMRASFWPPFLRQASLLLTYGRKGVELHAEQGKSVTLSGQFQLWDFKKDPKTTTEGKNCSFLIYYPLLFYSQVVLWAFNFLCLGN